MSMYWFFSILMVLFQPLGRGTRLQDFLEVSSKVLSTLEVLIL